MARTIASRRQKTSAGRFVGRFAEQQLFRATLRELAALRDHSDEQLTDDELSYAQIFLIAAEGGMGKTTLLRRFAAIVEENNEGAGAQALYLDCERHAPIADPDKLMRVLHDALCAAGFEREMQPYRDTLAKRGVAQKKAADAEEKYKSLASFGDKAAELATGGLPDSELADLREFIRKKLDPDEWKLYDDPDAVTEIFMEALNSIATPKQPLALLLDTYELADRFDSWLRKRALPQSNPRLIWALAGREGQPFIRRYEDEFGATLIGRILLDTFARPDIVAYLQQCGIATPDDELIDRLQALSRGIPLALEGWFNLYQKDVELPPPDPAAPTTRREIVRTMTDRFLRYCNEDDKHLAPAERRQREATRNHILTLMLLRRTDAAALAAAWQCDAEQAEATLSDLADQFSFIFAQEIEREPHALVKEFLRQHLRDLSSLPAAMQSVVARLVTYFEARLRQRQHELWTIGSSSSPAAPTEEQAALLAEREAHQRRLAQLNIQLADYGVAAPAPVRTDHDQAERAIAEIDAKLAAATSSDPAADGPRRPLWNDETWRETLLDLVNGLCWADRSGKRAMQILVPMFVEAMEFAPDSAAVLINTAEEFVDSWQQKYQPLFRADASASHRLKLLHSWQQKYQPLFRTLAAGRFISRLNATSEELRAIINSLQPAGAEWQLTVLQRAILHLQRGSMLIAIREKQPEDRDLALACAGAAAALLPEDGGELADRLADLYRAVGEAYLWPKDGGEAILSSEAVRILAIASQLAPKNQYAWFAFGVAYFKLRQYEESIAALQHAITLDPTYAPPHNTLGGVYSALKRYDESIPAFQQAIQLDPTSAYPHNGLGNVYLNWKRYDEALAAFQQAIQLDSTYASPHNNMGSVYDDLKRYDEARIAYQKAIDLGSQSYSAMGCLARIEQQLGNQEQAATWLAKAHELLPDNDPYGRACLESIAGDADTAIDALRIALEHGSSVEWARDDPDFVFIRDDPRYRALVGLDDAAAG
jgi:tetratricopeptide (TPR) repeat protein